MANRIGRAFEQTIFAVKETTKGVPAYPSAASEMIVGAGFGEINQQPTFTDSENIVKSLDVLERFQDMVGAGSWSIPVYATPSGSAGTAPMGAVLFESLQGVETIVGATSVTYSQAVTKPSFTLWMKRAHTLFFAWGATAGSCGVSATNKGGALLQFSGGFMKMGWAGSSLVSGAVTADPVVTVATGQGKFFTAGARVSLGSDNNTNAGYEVESVSGDDVTMAEAVTVADGEVIEGFLPVFTPVGAPLPNKETVITIDAIATKVKSIDMTIGSPVVYLENEITPEGYPTDYIEDRRDISGTLNLVFRSFDVGYFEAGYDGTIRNDVLITIGDVPGSIFKINAATTQLEVPAVSVDGPATALAMGLKALGSGAGENSITFAFE